jgi:hypothetical protein
VVGRGGERPVEAYGEEEEEDEEGEGEGHGNYGLHAGYVPGGSRR